MIDVGCINNDEMVCIMSNLYRVFMAILRRIDF
jgi:hypothetical protein